MRRTQKRAVGAIALGLVAALSACGSDDGVANGTPTSPSQATTPSGQATGPVNVKLQEYAVVPQQTSVSAGAVTFIAENTGPDLQHELVVIKTDLEPASLPISADGTVDENGAGIQIIGEIEEFPVGETKQAVFQLTAGKYVLICNLLDEPVAHYRNGMRSPFTVT